MFHVEQRLNFRIICRKKETGSSVWKSLSRFYCWIKPVQKILPGRCSV